MPTLKARREETDMVEVFKIMSGISDVDPQAWFTMNMPAEGGRRPAERKARASPPGNPEKLLFGESVRKMEQFAMRSETVQKCEKL